MRFIPTELPDVIIIEPKVFADERGFFMESYHQKLFQDNGIRDEFVQDNVSRSVQGTLRGLHYQLNPFAQGKLVRVTRGAVYDIAVDVRRGSPQFGRWVGVELSEENKNSLYIPRGFAHGFYVLCDVAEFTYKCTTFYAPDAERGIIWNDADIAIRWPTVDGKIILSEKDKSLPPLKDAEFNFVYGE
jgi:dTDP-4-dehydrorhamnose 3,5-epimerase